MNSLFSLARKAIKTDDTFFTDETIPSDVRENVIRHDLSKIGEITYIDYQDGSFYTDIFYSERYTRLYRNLSLIKEVKWKDKIGNVRDPEAEGQPDKLHIQEYLNGYGHGIRREWYDNGKLRLDDHFITGKLHGIRRQWHVNGNRKSEETYINGQADGIFKEWYDNGNPKSEGMYFNGQGSGLWKGWHANGNPQSEGTYTDGEKSGVWYFWSSNKQIGRRIDYDDSENIDLR